MRTSRAVASPRMELGRVAAKQHGVFERQQARAAGCDDSRLSRLLAAGEIERMEPRVFRFTSSPSSPKQRAQAALLYAGEGAWLSHRSAAALLGMIDRWPSVIEIISERDLRSRPGLKIRHGHVPRRYTKTTDRLVITDAIRTMVDLASVLRGRELEFVLDDCLYRGCVERDRLLRCVRSLGTSGRRRTRELRELLAVRGEGLAVELSVLEQQFLNVLREAGIEEPEKQVEVESDEATQWRLDFVYPQHRVLIEVDGRRFHAGRLQRSNDMRRDNVMNLRGWTVLRFTWDDVMNHAQYVVEQIRQALGIVALR